MSYLALFPWILFYTAYSWHIYLDIKEEEAKDLFKWMKLNFWKMFRIDILLLIAIFIYFVRFDNHAVDLMLFFMINLYLFINILYEIPAKQKKVKINLLILLPYLLIISLPIIYYIFTKNFVYTSFIMFGYTFLAYIIVILVKILSNYILGGK